MDPDRYLRRIGIDPGEVGRPDRETLARLQRAHVTSVPFETLSITGDPHGPGDGEGVSLHLPDLYGKVVERRRGGYCYELNGLFGWLLSELGYATDRLAGRVGSDGDFDPPANHHVNRVTLDREYLVDVGVGTPTMRRPLPLDGTPVADEVGVEWRVVESDRPDADYRTEYRDPSTEGWATRYVFGTRPRKLTYFEATCDYLSTAPESPFTGDPVVTVATDRGHRRLDPARLTTIAGGEKRERPVDPDEWHDLLEREFGIRFRQR